MNIRNPEVRRLAQQVAKLTGESLAVAISQSLRERLERLRSEGNAGLAGRLLAIGRDCAPRLQEPFRSAGHGDLLYDENGLPR
ncbi:MAG: type II toxin-antitoxin system VapB family antitoxin [Bryobacteraceae bacterium]